MKTIIVGVGGFAITKNPGEVVKALTLGSSVGLAVTTEDPKTASLMHVALPDSKTSKEKAKLLPGYFADSGVKALLNELKNLKVTNKSKIKVKLAGGAGSIGSANIFDIGQRNVSAIKEELSKYHLTVEVEDVGSNMSRSVWLEFDTGRYYASSPVKGTWEI